MFCFMTKCLGNKTWGVFLLEFFGERQAFLINPSCLLWNVNHSDLRNLLWREWFMFGSEFFESLFGSVYDGKGFFLIHISHDQPFHPDFGKESWWKRTKFLESNFFQSFFLNFSGEISKILKDSKFVNTWNLVGFILQKIVKHFSHFSLLVSKHLSLFRGIESFEVHKKLFDKLNESFIISRKIKSNFVGSKGELEIQVCHFC